MSTQFKGQRPDYDLDSLEGIESIEIPKYQPLKEIQSPVDNIEYILQRKATEHKRNGRMGLAIACLRKSNEIFPYSNFLWSSKDYMRLVEFLKQDNKFDEAREEEQRINELFQSSNAADAVFDKTIENCNALNTDLVEMTDTNFCVCGYCAKFAKRIFSVTGKNKLFPVLPTYLSLNLKEHEYCVNNFYPFNYGTSVPTWNYVGGLKDWSNRPFIDERTPDQKAYFEKRVRDSKQEIIDRENYDLLREKLPTIAPKSFGGFRRMKNLQSDKFISLYKAALSTGVDLSMLPDLSTYKF
jgi:hypothetical protein